MADQAPDDIHSGKYTLQKICQHLATHKTIAFTPDETQRQKMPRLPTDTPNLMTDKTSQTPQCLAERHNQAR